MEGIKLRYYASKREYEYGNRLVLLEKIKNKHDIDFEVIPVEDEGSEKYFYARDLKPIDLERITKKIREKGSTRLNNCINRLWHNQAVETIGVVKNEKVVWATSYGPATNFLEYVFDEGEKVIKEVLDLAA